MPLCAVLFCWRQLSYGSCTMSDSTPFRCYRRKDACGKTYKEFVHKTPNHKITISLPNHTHEEDIGGVLIEIEVNGADAEAKVYAYLNPDEASQMADIIEPRIKKTVKQTRYGARRLRSNDY